MPRYLYVKRGSVLKSLGSWPDITGTTPPPPTAVLNVGASASNTNLTTFGQKYAVHRTYNSGAIPASYDASAAAGDFAAGRHSVWSCPPDIVAFGNGTLDGAFNAFIDSVPAGIMPNGRRYTLWCNMWHEPDVKVKNGGYTSADFRKASGRMCDMIAASGRTDIIGAVNNTGQVFSGAGTGTDWGDPLKFYIPGKHGLYLIDEYNKWGYDTTASGNHYNGNNWSTMADRFAAFTAWVQANNVPAWGVGETNATEDVNTSGGDAGGLHDKSAWLTDGLAHLIANRYSVFCYWDNNFNSDYDPTLRRLHSSAAFKTAWSAALTLYGSA